MTAPNTPELPATLDGETSASSRDNTGALFSFRGRARRSTFWAVLSISLIVDLVFRVLAVSVNDPSSLIVLGVLLIIPSGWIGLATYVKRWHDLNLSGWFTLTLLIPLVNLLIMLALGILPGTAGENKYGPDPRGASSATPPSPPVDAVLASMICPKCGYRKNAGEAICGQCASGAAR